MGLVLYSFVFIQPVSLLAGAFNPFTFKVIIDMYDLIAILLTILDLVLWLFFSSLLLLFSPLVV